MWSYFSKHKRYADRIRTAARFWDQSHADADDIRYWLEVPAIVGKVNQRITGEASVYPLTAFLRLVQEATPIAGTALSVGCGAGHLERQVIRGGGARVIDGIDPSARSLEIARAGAAAAGMSERIRYHCADVVTWLESRPDAAYDLIFFYGSLHHIEALEQVLDACAGCLRGGDPGWMLVEEYVGPSRGEWRDEHMAPARRIFEQVPPEYRRSKQLRPPIVRDDPTEMIRSSEIVPLLRERFEVLHYRPYYGNVLQPLIAGIKGSALDQPAVAAVVEQAIELEDELIAEGAIEPFYAALALRPLGRDAAPTPRRREPAGGPPGRPRAR